MQVLGVEADGAQSRAIRDEHDRDGSGALDLVEFARLLKQASASAIYSYDLGDLLSRSRRLVIMISALDLVEFARLLKQAAYSSYSSSSYPSSYSSYSSSSYPSSYSSYSSSRYPSSYSSYSSSRYPSSYSSYSSSSYSEHTSTNLLSSH